MPRKTAAERELEEKLERLKTKETADQISVLATRVGDIAGQMVLLLERDTQKTKSIAALQEELETMHTEVSDIKEYADRWKGGFYAIVGLGGAVGATFAFWDRVRLIWAH